MRFGYDFSQVRLHSGGEAELTAHKLNAQAFTTGHNIAFGAGQFSPATHDGKRLLAHELTHVVQQRNSGNHGFIQRKVNAIRFKDEPTLLEISEGKESSQGE